MMGKYLAIALVAVACANISIAHPPPENDCGCSSLKPHVYIQQQPPIVVDRKAQNVVVKAGGPILIKPAPVIINRPGQVEVRPVVVKHQPKPVVVSKKIVQISRPIVKKFYVEKYSKQEDCPCKDQTVNVEEEPTSDCGGDQ